MKENKYDNPAFFEQYKKMARSVGGLEAAGEWHALKQLLPDFQGKRVLDLGCGFGWHCRYAVEQEAHSVIGIDISEKMLTEARRMTDSEKIQYIRQPIEDIDYPADSFDIVLSSLAFHYIASFEAMCVKVNQCLVNGGMLIFSVEHPVFSAYGSQSWYDDMDGHHLHWPVDHYFNEGQRQAVFLGERVIKYHRTLTTYLNGLMQHGFVVTALVEPMPAPALLDTVPGMRDELRRPMMLLVAAQKVQNI